MGFLVFALWILLPPQEPRFGRTFNLGLDLRGGTHLIYEADLSKLEPGEDPDRALSGVVDVIARRIAAAGISEPIIQKVGRNRISVQLPGIRNPEKAIELIGKTAELEFMELYSPDAPWVKYWERRWREGDKEGGEPILSESWSIYTLRDAKPEEIRDILLDLGFLRISTPRKSKIEAFILKDLELSEEAREKLEEKFEEECGELEICDFDGEEAVWFSRKLPPLEEFSEELRAQGYEITPSLGEIFRFTIWKTEDLKPDEDIEAVAEELKGDLEKLEGELRERLGPAEVTEPAPLLWVPAVAQTKEGNWVPFTGKYLKSNATAGINYQTGEPEVDFELKGEGPELFADITTRLVGRPLGIFLDRIYISSPNVREPITGGRGRITGVTLEEAEELALLLNSGALPIPLGHFERGEFLSGPAIREDVDPTLGREAVRWSLIAGIIGFVLILAFMCAYYRVPGLVGVISLIIYIIFVLALFKMRLIPLTLTLPGIAALILSIGMAVDANILIVERMKEELRAGRTFQAAVEAGYARAWPAIRDGNFTTFIICVILLIVGRETAEPRIMSFGGTLLASILVSMFAAMVISKAFMRILAAAKAFQKPSLWFMPVGRSEERR